MIFDSFGFEFRTRQSWSSIRPRPLGYGATNFEDEIRNVFKSAKIELCVIR